jgi:hypothetical protein
MAPSEDRIGEIESLFRHVNERIPHAADRYEVESAEFFYECYDPACGERLMLTLNEYERVRAESTRFVHAPGHVDPVYERVVARKSLYAVVEKLGRGLATIVRRLDPRHRHSGDVAEERATWLR